MANKTTEPGVIARVRSTRGNRRPWDGEPVPYGSE